MESMKFNRNDHPPNEIADGSLVKSEYFYNQVSKNQNLAFQAAPQCSNVQFNSMPGHYSRQMNASDLKNYPPVHHPPLPSKPLVGPNGYVSGTSSNEPPNVSNMFFPSSNYHFQPYPSNHVVSAPLPSSITSTQDNHKHLFNVPPPSVIPAGKMDPMQFGQFNFPPPSIPTTAPYFPYGYAESTSSLPNDHTKQYFNHTSLQAAFPNAPNTVPSQSSSYQPTTMSQIISNIQSTRSASENKRVISEKENLLNNFLQKFNIKEKHQAKGDITVVEYRSTLQKCFSLLNLLQSSKENLVAHLNSNQKEWEIELMHIKELKEKLSEACSVLSFPNNLTLVQRKIKAVKRKRVLRKKLKTTIMKQRVKKEEERERLHQEIDKWLDNLKEKNEKMKREIEMKKEADNILAEVRRKIHEAKRTLEKLKVFEKLRSVRQANAVQKGLYQQSEHSAKFEAKISHLRETMLAQLCDYEQEEKALQVMLETEQEDRREEEALWRKRKLMALQQKKQKAILESLFGDSVEPAPDDPMFLFYQYQNSGNKSTDNLVQIRHHWDVHLSEEGESIPLQWVVPTPPSSSLWEEY